MSARMRAGVRMMVGVRQPEPNTFGLIVDLTVDLIVDCSRNTVIVYCTYSGMMATPLMASSKSGVSGEKSFRQLMAKAYTSDAGVATPPPCTSGAMYISVPAPRRVREGEAGPTGSAVGGARFFLGDDAGRREEAPVVEVEVPPPVKFRDSSKSESTGTPALDTGGVVEIVKDSAEGSLRDSARDG